jgi:hypothetical protein
VSVDLVEQSDSGQSGEATLKAVDDERTRIVIKLSGDPKDPEPAHIHERACDDIDPTPTDTLQPVVDGRSETIISVSLKHLRTSPHSINIQKSMDALDEYVACGTIGEGGSLLP